MAEVTETSMRFANHGSEKIDELLEKKDQKSTKKTVDKSVKLFREFLLQKKEHPTFESYDNDKLNNELKLSYVNIRTKDGKQFKQTSMTAMKYGLAKYLKEKNGMLSKFFKSRSTIYQIQ